MHFIAIVGTNTKQSTNRQLLQFMADHFSSEVMIEVCEIKDIPMFNENKPQNDDPIEVKELTQKIAQADGIIIGCPEYTHSFSSALKSTLEWLSYRVHPLAEKPVMLVGASKYATGASRAQAQVREVLDSPGVNAKVLPGNEFLLGNSHHAFDSKGNIKDKKTIEFLEQCFSHFLDFINNSSAASQKPVDIAANKDSVKFVEEDKSMESNKKIRWDASYDVVVLGFGGAGATAARFAADDGAKVLLVDSAPEGHEGGNTRYAAQLIGSGDDFDGLKKYYKNLTAPMNLDEEMIDTYVEGMVGIPDYLKKYLDVEPVSWRHDDFAGKGVAASIIAEFPEFPGAQSHDLTTVHEGVFDAALWQNLKQQVAKRSDKIDVLYSTPARKLIQNPVSKVVCGVEIEREHVLRNVKAKNGVVLAMGGFENNQQYIEDFLGAKKLTPLGSTYNKGAGIKMAQEVGADFWHMNNYESLGLLHGMAFAVEEGERGRLMLGAQNQLLSSGSIFAVGDDGSRYFNESEENRHGHIKNHGTWKVPLNQQHPYLVFDQTKKNELDKDSIIGKYEPYQENLLKADSIAQLAQLMGVNASILEKAMVRFEQAAKNKEDAEFHRDPKTLRAFDQGPFYAIQMSQTVLNTQGGPRRNSRSEILNPDGQPIPHLYSAGELGGICANQYQGGGNLAECLIFGKIAGQNAAVPKMEDTTVAYVEGRSERDTQSASSFTFTSDNKTEEENFTTGKNQYIGRSDAGIGGEVVVRLTSDSKKNIKNVEILKQSESGDVGLEALEKMPKEMVAKNKIDVDAVSGASVSSKALKSAVADALKQVNKEG
ncbi:NAD(P)H-dependent oxidoreductase [Tetragenococcus solitarius]|uniref:Urocanate reductase n=1 Tax=Tetragenococcus solitarius TaxID=71453 RepID=A0ABP6KGZ4_9ENTE|nr:NAD(P)H-dependent oxidoreductase [Tetragenococcus solitarius]